MHDDVVSGRSPLYEPLECVLGKHLSTEARRFVLEPSGFLTKVDFRDIADHPNPRLRSAEGYHATTGTRHTIWLNKGSRDFEALMIHEVMRGILIERGFPRTRPIDSYPCLSVRYLSSLLGSSVTDPTIASCLTKAGYSVYNREILTRQAIAEAWLDVPERILERYTFLFCKWTLLTVLLKLDSTLQGETVSLLYSIIRRKFAEPWQVGEELSTSIINRGFTEPHSALAALVQLREALKLEDRISVLDAGGKRL